jgi:hypothetical protein
MSGLALIACGDRQWRTDDGWQVSAWRGGTSGKWLARVKPPGGMATVVAGWTELPQLLAEVEMEIVSRRAAASDAAAGGAA